MNNNQVLALFEQYKQYAKTFSKYNIRIESIIGFCESGGTITQTHELYHKTTGGYWSKKPVESDTTEITAEQFLNHMTWIGAWLGVKVTGKSYTYCGYIPTRVTSVRPDGAVKSVVTFKFTK